MRSTHSTNPGLIVTTTCCFCIQLNRDKLLGFELNQLSKFELLEQHPVENFCREQLMCGLFVRLGFHQTED